jgi:hypothetical protein
MHNNEDKIVFQAQVQDSPGWCENARDYVLAPSLRTGAVAHSNMRVILSKEPLVTKQPATAVEAATMQVCTHTSALSTSRANKLRRSSSRHSSVTPSRPPPARHTHPPPRRYIELSLTI